jgi:arylsulfatase A-like enzyme
MKILWCVLSAFLLPLFVSAQPIRKPNIVLILADDLGWRDLGCYGSTFYETPNLDKLASQGMRFTQAYAACPVCSPTRASLMTGKYPARLKLTNFIGGERTGKLLPAPYLHQLPLEEVTIAEALKESGYTTAHFGKWHLGGKGFLPEDQGFDVSFGAANGAGATPSHFFPYAPKKNPARTLIPDGKPGEYLADRLTDEAIKFIETNKDKPFFVYLPHYAVHVPLEGKEILVEKYRKKKDAMKPIEGPRFVPEGKNEARQVQDHAVYAAMMESLDESVGRIMATLAELKLDDNTVVIFTSDNGGLSTAEGSPTSNIPLRAGKGWLYEGGIREPLIIKWPGVTQAGAASDRIVISNDVCPTLLEIAGAPPKPQQHIDAVSFAAILRGREQPERTPLFWHYPHYANQGGYPGGAVRAGDFKLIEDFEDMHVELFNLKEDLGEKTDLAAKMPEKVEELRKLLHDWRKSVDAMMPTPNPAQLIHADVGVD